MIEKLESDNTFGDNKLAKLVFSELRLLSQYLKTLNSYDNVVFDLSMARGLDYYTGVIFEMKVKGVEGLGSIGAGKPSKI